MAFEAVFFFSFHSSANIQNFSNFYSAIFYFIFSSLLAKVK